MGSVRAHGVQLNIDKPVCLAAQGDNPVWRWYVHLNFCGLRRLATGEEG
jgi:hypothetical protein